MAMACERRLFVVPFLDRHGYLITFSSVASGNFAA